MKRTTFDHTPDGLRKRLADLERQVADLNRVRNPPQPYNEVQASGGGDAAEAFSFYAEHPFDFLVPVGNYADWHVAEENYRSSGVAISPALPDRGIQIAGPPGVWHVNLIVDVYPVSTSPTSGRLQVGFGTNGGGHTVLIRGADFTPGGGIVRDSIALDVMTPSGQTEHVFFVSVDDITLNQDVEIYVQLAGHLIASSLA